MIEDARSRAGGAGTDGVPWPGGDGAAGRERSLIRLAVVMAGITWYVYAMFHVAHRPGFGARGTDLAYTAGVLVSVGAFAAGVVLRRRCLPYGDVLYAVAAAATAVVHLLAPHRQATAMLFVVSGFAAAAYPVRRSAPTVLTSATAIALGVAVRGRPVTELLSVIGLLGMAAGVRAARTREAARRTEQRNLVLAERARIAREIHDILAHSLSAQLVHLEGARLLIASGRTDEALDRVERARGLARSGLEETRRALATLRGDIPPIDEVLRELAGEHRTLGDARCELTITGRPRELEVKSGLAVIRTAQEALTNARKHAPGADVAVELRYLDDRCELEVTDSGRTGDPGPLESLGGGYGLIGMRERAELIGGTLEAGPDGKGFRVLLRVPL